VADKAPALYAHVMESWVKIRADGKVTLAEWWQFSTVVFGVAVNVAASLVGKTGPEKLDWAAKAAADVLLFVAPSLAGKIVGAVLHVISWIGWSWPLVKAFFSALYAGTVKGGVQLAYEKRVAELQAEQALARLMALAGELERARATIGEATGGPSV